LTAGCGTKARRYCAPHISGANPNNRNRHWQTDSDDAGNCQGECKKQIYLRAHVVYRHVAHSTTRINRNPRRTQMTFRLARASRKVRCDGAPGWLTKGYRACVASSPGPRFKALSSLSSRRSSPEGGPFDQESTFLGGHSWMRKARPSDLVNRSSA
jgi:hypothetical protein